MTPTYDGRISLKIHILFSLIKGRIRLWMGIKGECDWEDEVFRVLGRLLGDKGDIRKVE
jgi:hypothetical protein